MLVFSRDLRLSTRPLALAPGGGGRPKPRGRLISARSRAGLLAGCALLVALTGCNSTQAALDGGPRISDNAWLSLDGAPPTGPTASGKSYVPPDCAPASTSGEAPAVNPAINKCVDAMVLLINVRFAEFEKGLVGLNSGTNLALDVAGLGLNAAGALSGQSAAQILSAIAGGLAGTKSAINNDVLLQKSVEVIIQQMVTDRAQAYQVILAREDPKGDNPYTTMQQAAIDLYAFAAAGTWSNAISNLQACTGAQAQAGTTEVRTMKKKGAKKAAADKTAADAAAVDKNTNSGGCASSGT